MEAPTPTQSAPAALQHIPAAALLEAALESEAKVATLKETYEELLRTSVTGDATPRSVLTDGCPAGGRVYRWRLRACRTSASRTGTADDICLGRH